MEVPEAVWTAALTLVVLGIPMAMWMYSFAHAVAHKRRGHAFFLIFMPWLALPYALVHRCPLASAAVAPPASGYGS